MTRTQENVPRRRIAFVMTHYPRVALTFIASEIDGLERLGLDVLPIAMNVPSKADLDSPGARERRERTVYLKANPGRALADLAAIAVRHPVATMRLAATAVRSAGLDLGLIARRLSHLVQAASAARHCRASGVRHIHAQFGLSPATIAWFACEILNFRRDFEPSSWSFTIHGYQDFIDEKVARLDLKAASASTIVCISDFTRSQLCRVSAPAHWHKARVVRCGIDLDRFAYRELARDKDVPVIVTVGRLSAEKGQTILLEACRILADRQMAFRLDMIGAGPLEQELRSQIARLGLEGAVTLRGELPPGRVAEELALADLFCLPSFSEGLPVSIMEAMAVGVPVVTSFIAGIPELAVNEETALTVPPADPEALADALQRILGDAGLARRLTRAARQRVERLHDSRRTAAQMFELLASAPVAIAGTKVQ